MLPAEIAPFADHHIEKLMKVRATTDDVHPAGSLTLSYDEVQELREVLLGANRALTRFKFCMADEVKQKERYRKFAKENGYKFS